MRHTLTPLLLASLLEKATFGLVERDQSVRPRYLPFEAQLWKLFSAGNGGDEVSRSI